MLSVSKKSKTTTYIVIIGLCALIATGLFAAGGMRPHVRTSQIPSAVPSLPPQTTLHLRAVGDVMLGRQVAVEATKRQDWYWPFAGTTPFLPPADLLIGNLETPIISQCPLTSTGMIFCAPNAAVGGLRDAGFDVLSLANNHTTNYGNEGLSETVSLLNKADIISITDYATQIATVSGEQIGFLALNDTFAPINSSRAGELISDLRQTSSLVIVLVHWGNEYETQPSKRQQFLADQFISSGADIILGAHPHVLQPVEIQGNSLIAYSLGNFIFDQMWSNETRKGAILDMDITFTDKHISAINYLQYPTTIYDYGQPRLDANR